MDKAKISLSAKELQLVTDTHWILTKNLILKKTKQLLEGLLASQENYLSSARSGIPREVFDLSPKISRGENYKGLPFLVLDHPRCFGKENTFAVRTMFWWGHFFSITLHLAGRYKTMFEKKIIHAYPMLKEKKFYACIHHDQWEHDFEKDNFTRVSRLNKNDFTKLVRERSFIKLARKTGIKHWDDAGEILLQHFKQVIRILAD